MSGVRRGGHITLHTEYMQRDVDFCQFVTESVGSEVYSSIYLVGEGFERDWAKNLWLSFVNTSAGYFTEIICFPRVPAMLRKKRQRNGI